MLVNCQFCNKSYEAENYLVKSNKTKFCSKSCKSKNAIKKNLGTPIQRFFKNIKDDNNNDCWLWKVKNHSDGYGIIYINRKRLYAHRFSWEIHYGPIPQDLWILHKCDTPKCVNPEHLFLGTNKDNVRDMLNKGRKMHKKGIEHPRAKLTEQNIIDIRNMMEKGMHATEIGKLFNITNSYVHNICDRTNWKHIK